MEEEEEEEKRSLLERSYEKSFYPKDREVSFRSWNGKEILVEIQKFRYIFIFPFQLLKSEIPFIPRRRNRCEKSSTCHESVSHTLREIR